MHHNITLFFAVLSVFSLARALPSTMAYMFTDSMKSLKPIFLWRWTVSITYLVFYFYLHL